MVHKRYVKKGGKTYGPYYYKTVRDKDGNVKNVYLGSAEKDKRNVVQPKFLYLFLSLFFIVVIFGGFYIGSLTGNVVNLGSLSLSEFENQEIERGDFFSANLHSNLRAAYFTDDTDLFEISPEGLLEFRAEESGEYLVAIIAKSEEGFEYKLIKFTIR